jgi:DNA primase
MDEVAEVKSRLEITEVVGAYVPLKQAGRNLKAPCPFHQEKTASFMVSPEKGIYHCFGCGEGGDIFSFVQKMEGLDFRGALELLARKAGVELKARSGDNKEAQKLRVRLTQAHELAVRYFQANLVGNQKALEYVVQKRGLGRETIREFQIGYAPDSWEGLTAALQQKGFSVRELVQGGLAGQKQGRSTAYDLFRGRVMFTICDREGRPIGFTGRVLDDSVPKYLNTPQSPLYDKSTAVFGLHLAKEAIRQTDEVVLVEGQMDVVASHQAGVKQVIATSGTALTMEHLRSLSKLTKNIKLAFDADRAGLAATERAIEMGQKLGLMLRMVEMPEGVKDADELIKLDVEAWRRAIAEAKYIVDYLFDRFEKDFDLNSAMGKRGYADRLAANLRRLGDPVEQDHYVKLLAEKTGTSEEAVHKKIEQAGEQGAAPEVMQKGRVKTIAPAKADFGSRAQSDDSEYTRRAVMQAAPKTVQVQREEELLGFTLKYPEVRQSALHGMTLDYFSSDQRQGVYQLLRNSGLDAQTLLESVADEVKVYCSNLIFLVEEKYSDVYPEKHPLLPNELAEFVTKEFNNRVRQLITQKLKQAEEMNDEAEIKKLQQKYQQLLDRQSAAN